jgi:hypothetical protein
MRPTNTFEQRSEDFDQFLSHDQTICSFACFAAKNSQILYAPCPAIIDDYVPESLMKILDQFSRDSRRTLVLIPEIDPGSDRTKCLQTAEQIFVAVRTTCYFLLMRDSLSSLYAALRPLLKNLDPQSPLLDSLHEVKSTVVELLCGCPRTIELSKKLFSKHRIRTLNLEYSPKLSRKHSDGLMNEEQVFGFCMDPSYAQSINGSTHPRFAPTFGAVFNWWSDFRRLSENNLALAIRRQIEEKFGGSYDSGFYINDELTRTMG